MALEAQRITTAPETSLALWTEARFPNSAMRAEFMDQIRTWNRMEDLPKIHALASGDTTSLRYRCSDYRRAGLRKLVWSYGGRITAESGLVVRLEEDLYQETYGSDWSGSRAGR